MEPVSRQESLSLSIGFLFLGVLTLAGPASGQTSDTIATSGIRPVADALDIVQKRSGMVVTYEDPELVFAGDIVDRTAEQRRKGVMGGPQHARALTPTPHSLFVQYVSNADGSPSDLAELLRAIAQAGARNARQFRVWQTAQTGRYHLAPIALRDGAGKMTPVEPLLDTLVSFPPGSRSGAEYLAAICNGVGSAHNNRKVVVSRVPQTPETSRGASNERARDLIEEFLVGVDSALSWRFLCQPEQLCVLSIQRVQTALPAPIHKTDVRKDLTVPSTRLLSGLLKRSQ
jgi:hypothetical protein